MSEDEGNPLDIKIGELSRDLLDDDKKDSYIYVYIYMYFMYIYLCMYVCIYVDK
jgi:hypothetical protein